MTIKNFIILFSLGCLYALGFPNIANSSFLITPIIALVFFFDSLFKQTSLKKMLLFGLVFFLGFNLTGYHWITQTLQEFGGLPFILALIVNTLFSLIIMPYMWVGILFVYFLKKKNFSLTNGLQSFSLAIVFTLFEFYIPQQFDSYLGNPWIVFSKHLSLASFGGVILFSFFSFLLVFEALKLKQTKSVSKINVSLIILFIVLNPLLVKPKKILNKKLNVRVVQANISNFLKLESEKGGYATSSQVIERYKKLSLQKYTAADEIDLIIWPETAYPFSVIMDSQKVQETLIPLVFSEITQFTNAQLIAGGYESKHMNDLYMSDYNTAFHISNKGKMLKTYNKQILIPFGETLPFGSFNKYISRYIENISFFAKGEKFTVFELNKGIKAMATICYELLKPAYVREYLRSIDNQAQVMINLTNDSWYGKTTEPYQHLFLSKWRALEFDIPIIRSTNTGITSIIYSDGQESRRTALFKEENLDVSIELKERSRTFYLEYGILSLYIVFLLGLIINYLGLKFKNEN